MPRVSARVTVPGGAAEAEELWCDPNRWPAWVDGFGHVVRLQGDWPQVGARLVWDSRPRGRGRVSERVVAHEPRAGYTVEVQDGRLYGTQQVLFEPADGGVHVTLTLEYNLSQRAPLTPLVDLLYTRRVLRASLRRTVTRFGHERQAEVELGLDR